jgi:hypothetical protein
MGAECFPAGKPRKSLSAGVAVAGGSLDPLCATAVWGNAATDRAVARCLECGHRASFVEG